MVLTLALVMTGCMGGGLSKNQDAEIRLILDAYIENFKSSIQKPWRNFTLLPLSMLFTIEPTLYTPHQGEDFYERSGDSMNYEHGTISKT